MVRTKGRNLTAKSPLGGAVPQWTTQDRKWKILVLTLWASFVGMFKISDTLDISPSSLWAPLSHAVLNILTNEMSINWLAKVTALIFFSTEKYHGSREDIELPGDERKWKVRLLKSEILFNFPPFEYCRDFCQLMYIEYRMKRFYVICRQWVIWFFCTIYCMWSPETWLSLKCNLWFQLKKFCTKNCDHLLNFYHFALIFHHS